MNFLFFFTPAITAALISYLLAPLAGRFGIRVGAVDLPGPRKVHQRPIPRSGGLAVIAAVSIVAAAAYLIVPAVRWPMTRHLALGVGLGLLPILVVSIWDDIKPLRSGPKFLAHVLGATIAVVCGVSLNGDIHLFGHTIAIGMLAGPLSVLWIVGATNAFNIVDGLDGLSAGLALIAAISLSCVFLIAGVPGAAAGVLVVAGALAGFLPHNTYPARMFLGDTGAASIGFCLAAFALRGGATLSAGFATILPVFVLGLPIAETFISMARRLLRKLGEKDAGGVFEADGNHMHHRLLGLGIDHPRVVFILYAAGMVLASAALVSMLMTGREAAMLVVALMLAGVFGVKRLDYDEFALIRNGTAMRVYEVPVFNKSMFVVFFDLLLIVAATCCALGLKTDSWEFATMRAPAMAMSAVLAPVTVMIFSWMGLYRGNWRLAGVEDFVRLCAGVLGATLVAFIVRATFAPASTSISVFVIYALVKVGFAIGSRGSYQILDASRRRARAEGAPALIYGAGRKGASALRELLADVAAPLRPVGFIDDDLGKSGKVINGVPVVGSGRTLEKAIRRFAAGAVVVASDALPASRVAQIGELCERMGIAMLRMEISFDLCAGQALVPTTVSGFSSTAALANACANRIDAASHGCKCPTCGSRPLTRSHGRNIGEELRKRVSSRRLFRCQACGWRGWTRVDDTVRYEPYPTPPPYPMPTLDAVDVVLQ
jgi:UDP-GlcNAc:undecaprenyl-phosphate GlcNAc-1-phosphate transferase